MSEPHPIADDLEAALAGLKASSEKAATLPAPHSRAPDAVKINEKLEAGGFPLRHRLALVGAPLHGPAMAKARELLPRIQTGDCILLLVGDRGPGKTQMATWLAAQIVEERLKAGSAWSGLYRKTADIITEIKTTWAAGGKAIGTEDDVLRKYRSVKFLVLDEFHERGSSDWEARTLVNILDHRYDNMLVTIIIANLTEKQLRQEINPSIISRAEETGGLVLCTWPSYRTK